jgi:2-C-methyl-D-erythritol 4-phosphate cytidylyltransferase
MRNYAIVVAAGKGKRFGAGKQFHLIHGIPMFIYSVQSFHQNRHIHTIILVVPKRKIVTTTHLIKRFKLEKVKKIVAGGKRRQDSVLKGLNQLKRQSGIVLIHDGVRPLVAQSLIDKGIKLCKRHKAVIFGTAIGDTVKEAKNRRVVRTVPRRNLFLVQTPQFFDIKLLKKAFRQTIKFDEYTDEAAILEAQSIPVYIFQGQRDNIKVTRKEDLRLIEKLL